MSKIHITEFDSRRLRELINVAAAFGDKRTLQYLDEKTFRGHSGEI